MRLLPAFALLVLCAACQTKEQRSLESRRAPLRLAAAELASVLANADANLRALTAIRDEIAALAAESTFEELASALKKAQLPGLSSVAPASGPDPGHAYVELVGTGDTVTVAQALEALEALPPSRLERLEFRKNAWTIVLKFSVLPTARDTAETKRVAAGRDLLLRKIPAGVPTPEVLRLRREVENLQSSVAILESTLRARGFAEGGYEVQLEKKRLERLHSLRRSGKFSPLLNPHRELWLFRGGTLQTGIVTLGDDSITVRGRLGRQATVASLQQALPNGIAVVAEADGMVSYEAPRF